MAFVGVYLIFLAVVVIVCLSTLTASIILFIVAAVLKKKHLAQIKNEEGMGYYGHKKRKTYLIPKIIAFICLIPTAYCIGLVAIATIQASYETHYSLSRNLFEENTAEVEKLFAKGISPDCTLTSNKKATDGEETLLYFLADHGLRSIDNYNDNPDEFTHEKTLEFMKILIENGADVNYTTYIHEKSNNIHSATDEYSIYQATDKCGWTPLMVATYEGDIDEIKLLVENGADVNAVDYCGYNVIHIIADFMDDKHGYEILNYYLELGVKPNSLTNYGQSAIWLAERSRTGSNPLDNTKIRNRLMLSQ